MGRFTVDPAALHGVESAIAACVHDSQLELVALRTKASELRWRGAAAVHFHNGWGDWVAGVEHLFAALRELGVAVGISGTDYAATETTVCVAIDGTPA